MIKLTKFEQVDANRLLLRFSDGSWDVFDFTPFIASKTEMTAPLSDPDYFGRCVIELGALAWPNGFDLSARSFYRTLAERGELRRDAEATCCS
jgi:hypothetical protein